MGLIQSTKAPKAPAISFLNLDCGPRLRKGYILYCGPRLRKGEVFACVGLLQNLKDLKVLSTEGRGAGAFTT